MDSLKVGYLIHEVREMLSGVMGNIRMIRNKDDVDEIVDRLERADGLLKSIIEGKDDDC